MQHKSSDQKREGKNNEMTQLYRTYIQLHNYKSMIIHTFHPVSSFHFTSLPFTSLHFTSLHFTPHFSLPCTFGLFVTNLCYSVRSPTSALLARRNCAHFKLCLTNAFAKKRLGALETEVKTGSAIIDGGIE